MAYLGHTNPMAFVDQVAGSEVAESPALATAVDLELINHLGRIGPFSSTPATPPRLSINRSISASASSNSRSLST